MKIFAALWIALAFIMLAGCQPADPVCPPGTIEYLEPAVLIDQPAAGNPAAAGEVEIKGKLVAFDQVVHGPLCNNDLAGKVYVACDLQVARWEEVPNFFDGCNFQVEEGTIIYVASHNNTAYYKGCESCHISSGEPAP